MTGESTNVSTAEVTQSDYKRVFNQLGHMAALSRTGVTEHVVQGLIDRALVLGHDSSLSSAEDIKNWIHDTFRVNVSAGDTQRRIELGVQQRRIFRPEGQYRLRPDVLSQVENEIEAETQLEARVRSEWLAAANDVGLIPPELEPEKAWKCLRHYMAGVFQQHGYQSVQLLDPTADTSNDELVTLDTCIEEALTACGVADGEQAQALRLAINQFFVDPTTERTEYLMQLLDATFTFFALSAPGDASAYLRQTLQPLTVFVDTNVVFELLELHVTPDEAVAHELIEFIASNKLSIFLRVHKRTAREIHNTVAGIGSRLRGSQWSQAVSRAALRSGSANGIELKYHQLNSEQPLSPAVFMDKYEKHMVELLEGFGIESYRPTADTFDEQEKHLLVEEYRAFHEEQRPNGDQKPYDAADHDIAVWLTIRDMRTGGRSTLDSGAVFLSNDRMFRRFDQRELRAAGPLTVVLPRTLLQVLRPFGDDNADFNRRFVQAFAAPGFRTAHSDYDETTSELLSLLATYKDVPEEAAFRILSDEMVRASMKDGADPAELIESEVTRLNLELMEDRESLTRANEESARKLASERERADAAEALLQTHEAAIAELTEKAQEQEQDVDREVAAKVELASALDEATGRIAALEDAKKLESDRRAKRRHALKRCAIGAATALVLIAVAWAVHWATGWPDENHENRIGLIFFVHAGSAVIGCAAGYPGPGWKGWPVAIAVLAVLGTIAPLL